MTSVDTITQTCRQILWPTTPPLPTPLSDSHVSIPLVIHDL